MKPFYLYILRCADGSYYVGQTDDIDKRLSEHSRRIGCAYTTARLPITLVFLDAFPTRSEAFCAERKIKNWSRKKKEALMRGDWQTMSLVSKKSFKR
jgi:predicted GIY-YIG superfamily endonuclease